MKQYEAKYTINYGSVEIDCDRRSPDKITLWSFEGPLSPVITPYISDVPYSSLTAVSFLVWKLTFTLESESLVNEGPERLVPLAKDENFRKFLSDSRVQALLKDKEFEKAVKEKDIFKLMSHQEFSKVLKDPEIALALEQMRQKYEKSS